MKYFGFAHLAFLQHRYTDGFDSDLVREVLVALIRSKGFLWLASRPDAMLYWSVAGTHLEVTEKGKFCEDTTGIPKQELVFIFLQVKLQQSDASTQKKMNISSCFFLLFAFAGAKRDQQPAKSGPVDRCVGCLFAHRQPGGAVEVCQLLKTI